MHVYTTHICQNAIECMHCRSEIRAGDEFAVVTTPSKPGQIDCLTCTDQRLDSGEKHLRVESTVGDHPGSARSGNNT